MSSNKKQSNLLSINTSEIDEEFKTIMKTLKYVFEGHAMVMPKDWLEVYDWYHNKYPEEFIIEQEEFINLLNKRTIVLEFSRDITKELIPGWEFKSKYRYETL